MSLVLHGTDGVTFNDSSLQGAAASPYGLKNKLINGEFRIDQRNAGASVATTPTDGIYTLDRWQAVFSVASKFTVQQNAGSVTPPAGFNYYLGVTSTSAYTSGSSDYLFMHQKIEGYNVSDLAWGTASAKTVTLSFWVRSSLTGTFGGALANSDNSRNYAFNYTISSANTWEQKTVTITGDTSGTWLTTNGVGLRVLFNIGSGSSLLTTAGSWGSTWVSGGTGSTAITGTNGATWYVTGTQLELGSTATPFERRMYGQELALCQRYYWKWQGNKFLATAREGNSWWGNFIHPVTMRVSPTISSNFTTFAATGPSATGQLSVYGNGWKSSSGSPAVLLDGSDIWDAQPYITGFAGTYSDSASIISSGFTFIDFSAEL